MATVTKKDKFFEVLRNIFVGAKIEGNSGYVNLMKIKSKYYNEFKEQLHIDIDAKLKEVGQNFEEELYNKLFTFFKKYFSESGSIYFSYTPLQEKVYERIYRDDKDVMLFWKTHMLYYVKTERLFKNMEVEDEDIIYLFDVGELQHKKSNEKKDLVFELFKTEHTDKRRIYFSVKYSANGSKTKTEEILKKIKKEKAFGSITLKQVERVLGIFKRQSEVDYFINKDAKGFLKEQFSLWIKGYLLDDETLFETTRLNQLKALQQIAFNIIDLVGQFEDELVKVWNKPKFAHSSNYVITLDRIFEKKQSLLELILKHKEFPSQMKEWIQLGLTSKDIKKNEILENNTLNEMWKYLPLDTKYFKDIEVEILAIFENLELEISGYAIKSDNYQAINTLKFKFQNQIQFTYLDPPYNSKSSEIIYINNYKHSSWATLLENRLSVTKALMKDDGIVCVTIDDYELPRLWLIMESIFGIENHLGTIAIRINPKGRKTQRKVSAVHEYAVLFGKSDKAKIKKLPKEIEDKTHNYQKDEDGSWYLPVNLRKQGADSLAEKDNGDVRDRYYPIYYNSKTGEISSKKKFDTEIWPIDGNGVKRIWRRGIDAIDKMFEDKDLWLNETANGNQIYFKFRGGLDGEPPQSIWYDAKFSASEYGTKMLDNILGVREAFDYPKSPYAVMESINIACEGTKNNYILDYFGGSGTTAISVVNNNKLHTLDNKFIVVEMGDHFDNVVIPRIKKNSFSENWLVGKPIDNNGSSTLFKYFYLEQYQESLSKSIYEDKNSLPTQDIYHQYLFLKDLKLADDVIKLDEKSKSIKVDLTKLHPAIDIPETLSHLTGKFIKQIKKDEVVFTDGTSIDLTNIDYKIVKPLIWW